MTSVEAFCKSLAVPTPEAASKLQDILRLLHLWFNYGHLAAVGAALRRGFDILYVDTWLKVIPQSSTNKAVLASMRVHSPLLVEQAFLVSRELIRSAFLWDEMWYEALEEA